MKNVSIVLYHRKRDQTPPFFYLNVSIKGLFYIQTKPLYDILRKTNYYLDRLFNVLKGFSKYCGRQLVSMFKTIHLVKLTSVKLFPTYYKYFRYFNYNIQRKLGKNGNLIEKSQQEPILIRKDSCTVHQSIGVY